MHNYIITKKKKSSASTDTSLTGDEGITETHHATCKIATEEIVASARATVTRVLTGACTASKKQ